MKKMLMLLLPCVAVATGAAAMGVGSARAQHYSVLQESDCKLITPGQLSQVMQKVGTDAGLDLPEGMALRAEVRCALDHASKRYVYTIRAAIDKQVNDGEAQRWTSMAQLTGFGTTTTSAALLREVGFTLRDVIRQEP